MEIIIKSLAAIKRNFKLCCLIIIIGATSYGSYQHGKYVGSLGGQLDTAGLDTVMAAIAAQPQLVQVADAGYLAMPPTIDEMSRKEKEEEKNYRINNRKGR